ncbi:MAG: hypothetical protein JXA72_00005 [Bacteroidales bacterium]|nr:hypothetical protein [Bacteroidales bacterium]
MKTTSNINRNTSILMTAAIAVFAATGTLNAGMSEEARAAERIEKLTGALEYSLKYEAPENTESLTSGYPTLKVTTEEVQAALESIDSLTAATEESLRYQAPQVSDDIANYEINAAWERLENLNLAIEEEVRYQAPEIAEEKYLNEAVAALDAENSTLAAK